MNNAILVIFGALILIFFLCWFVKSMRNAETFAKEHGLTIRKRLFGYHMEGLVRGIPISLRTERNPHTGGSVGSEAKGAVVLCADVSKAAPSGFVLQRDFGDPRVARTKTSIPELDNGYIMQCPDVEAALSLLRQDSVRSALTALVSSCPNFFIRYGRIEVRRRNAELDAEIAVLMEETAAVVIAFNQASSKSANPS